MTRRQFGKWIVRGGVLVPFVAPLVTRAADIIVPGPVTPAAAGGGPDITTGLLGWWKFDEASGDPADSSGNSNGGTLQADATYSTGHIGAHALSLDGTGDYVSIANPSNFSFGNGNSFTLAAWIKANSSLSNNGGIFNKANPGGNGEGYYFFYDNNAALKVFLIGSNGSTISIFTGVNSVPINQWHHLVMTYDGSSTGAGTLTYIDKVFSTAGTGTLTASMVNTSALLIGNNPSTFFGEIDDARVYNRVLSQTEIDALYAYT